MTNNPGLTYARRPSAARKALALPLLILFLGGPPVMIAVGLQSIQHASQIAAGGVAAQATVTYQITEPNGPTCQAVNVSYRTAGGQAEQGSVDIPGGGSCPPVGATLNVVYDPSAPGVVQLAGQRGSITGGMGTIIMGSFFTLLTWGFFGWGLWIRLRRRRAAGGPVPVNPAAGITAPVHPGGDDRSPWGQ